MFKNYAKCYDLINQEKPYKKECNFIYKWADYPYSILDIGCGTANYWKYYPSIVSLTGIDNSPEMIEQAGEGKELHCLDITNTAFISEDFDCVTALFNVVNYMSSHKWWRHMPLRKGGYFIFDIWDAKKVDRDGFQMTVKRKEGITRVVTPIQHSEKQVVLDISIADGRREEVETHVLNIYSEADIMKFCGKQFKIVDKRETRTWQTWYKLRRK